MRTTFSTPVPVLSLALALACVALAGGCGPKAPTDALDAARLAVDGSLDAEPCAEAEVRAARSLLQQAEDAYAVRDFARARQLADAARLQAERARQVAADNAENCNRVQELTQIIEDVREQRNTGEPVITDYEFTPIFFAFDSSTLDDESRRVLNGHAEQMTRNPSWRMSVEGHCDSAGSTEYNLALGERRARAVKDYLVRMGVEPPRVTTVSYGAEMPAGSDNNRNRRAEFRVRR